MMQRTEIKVRFYLEKYDIDVDQWLRDPCTQFLNFTDAKEKLDSLKNVGDYRVSSEVVVSNVVAERTVGVKSAVPLFSNEQVEELADRLNALERKHKLIGPL